MTHGGVEVGSIIEHRQLGPLQYRVLACAIATIVFDGFDIQALAFAAPKIIQEWGLAPSAMGPTLAAALIGMALGTLIGGIAGDAWGRKPTLIVSIALFGLCSLAVALATTPFEITVWRFLAGLGMGGAVPSAGALVVEWMPVRLRNLGITLVLVGLPIGGLIGASLSAWLIPAYGWRACFVVGGIAPLVLAAATFAVPESPRFLALHAKHAARLSVLITRFVTTAGIRGDEQFTFAAMPDQTHSNATGMRALFSSQYRRATVGLWLAFFGNLLANYGFLNWIPVLLSSHGFPLATAIRGSLYYNLAGIAGQFLCSWAMVRFGSRTVLLCAITVGITGIAATGYLLTRGAVGPDAIVPLLLAGFAIIGGAVLGCQLGLYSIAASAYETEARATGIGAASSIGRLGAIISAFTVGAVLALPAGESLYFAGVGLFLVMAGIGVGIVDRHTVGFPCRNSVPTPRVAS